MQYYERYLLPVMHTETSFLQGPTGQEAVDWLWKQWSTMLHIRNKGVPIIGFTWPSLTDQVDWDSSLRENRGTVNALGLFNLEREIRPVGKAYRCLIESWRKVLPTQSICLRVPVESPRKWTMRQNRPPPSKTAVPDEDGLYGESAYAIQDPVLQVREKIDE